MKQRITLPPWAQQLAAVVALVLASASITIDLADTNGDGSPDAIDVTVDLAQPVQTPANVAPDDGLPTATVEAPAALVQKVAVTEDHAHLEAAPTEAVRERVREAVAEDDSKPLPTGGAVQGFAGCKTRILPTNWSSRPGVRPIWQVDHYTVSHNVPGWTDVWAIWSLFANPGRKASSNFIIDAEGHCVYAVPIEAKAWTQAGGNPWSVSYEIIAYGDESDYLSPAGWAKLRSVQHQVAKRTGIPLRRGSVAPGGVPGTSGIVQHKDGGLAWGGHVDITPFSIDRAVAMVIQHVEPPSPLTKREQKLRRGACRPKGTGHSARYWRARARARVKTFDRAHARGRSWRFHDIGKRRQLLARAAAGRC